MIYRSFRCLGGPWDGRRLASKALKKRMPVRGNLGAYVLAGTEDGGSVHVYRWEDDAV